MTKANPKLIAAIEKTVAKLSHGPTYQWGHMGACNCGNLAQELTSFTKAEIHRYATRQRHGVWNEQLLDYCPASGFPMGLMISKMLDLRLAKDDLSHLERLSDLHVLSRIPKDRRDKINKNERQEVIHYMETWANLLREKWVVENHPKLDFTEEKKLKLPVLV